MLTEKQCNKCGEAKAIAAFYKQKGGRDGLHAVCKSCMRNTAHEKYAENPDHGRAKAKKWRLAHPERARATDKKYQMAHVEQLRNKRKTKYAAEPRGRQNETYAKHPERFRARARKWYSEHREQSQTKTQTWKMEHPAEVKAMRRRAHAKLMSTPRGRLNNSVKSSIHHSLYGSKAGRHWEDLVGFTIDQLRKHLEKLFKPGMTWENYGTVWSVDHKTPIAVFNFAKPEDIDFKLCWSLKNLQPLGKIENIKKNDKIDKPFQPSLMLATGL